MGSERMAECVDADITGQSGAFTGSLEGLIEVTAIQRGAFQGVEHVSGFFPTSTKLTEEFINSFESFRMERNISAFIALSFFFNDLSSNCCLNRA